VVFLVSMITGYRIGDVLKGPEAHVAFALGSELAGSIASEYWPELRHSSFLSDRKIISKYIGNKLLHGLAIRRPEDGWKNVPSNIEYCFNELQVANGEEVASVALGRDMKSLLNGADPIENLAAMERSNKNIILYQF
jgi:hypothetical protein